MSMSGAGTAEGWEETGKYLYACPEGHYQKEGHLAWIWWCPKCGFKAVGPHVEGFSETTKETTC